MKDEFKRIEEKVKKSLGIDKLPDCELKIDSLLGQRIAFNQKVGSKYIITISPGNLSGLKHELIHLALKQFSSSNLKINLPVPKKYEKDDKTVRFMEYLTIVFEIKMGNPEKIEENLNNYEKYGFSQIKEFYNITNNYFNNHVNQKLINKIIES